MQHFTIRDETIQRGRGPSLFTCAVMVISVALCGYWLLFAMRTFPWIVPADNNSDYVKAYSHAAVSGVVMCVVSACSAVLATRVLARSALGWGLAAFLLVFMVVACAGLYPALGGMQLPPGRTAAQLLNVAVIAIGACWRPK